MKKQKTWFYDGVTVAAYTKSEARAMLKKYLGFKHRLPVGVIVERID